MPLDDGFFSAAFRCLGTVVELIGDWLPGRVFGWIGSRVIRVVTLGFQRPSSDSVFSIALGFVIVVISLVFCGIS